jgi:hypothetical protein
MENGSLFNPGFLGASFNWWIGQIADDSTWRDNIIPGKFENQNAIPGWGYRYKVRIIGLHDQGETEIPSNQLPWAQVMFPITAGGGQTSSSQTPNIRQGNMVFGFFLDEKDQQVPVIMGVLGNNQQTTLATTIGDNRVTNQNPGSLATSGYAEGQNPPPGTTKPAVPDSNLSTAGQTIEGVNSVHLISNGDVKRNELYNTKTVIIEPNDLIGSCLKAIKIELENLSKLIDKIAHTTNAVIDAISIVEANASCESAVRKYGEIIAKYLKIIFYNIYSFIEKEINKSLSPTVDLLFPNDRHKYLDIKEILTELLNCLFKKLIGELADLVISYLSDIVNCNQPSPNNNAPFVPMCTAENLVGDLLSNSKGGIQSELDKIFGVANSFLGDFGSGLAEIQNITANLITALDFNNTILKFFGCDSLPNRAASDYYTIQSGGGGITEQFLPNFSTIAEAFNIDREISKKEPVPFAVPTRIDPIDYSDRRTTPEEIQSRNIA